MNAEADFLAFLNLLAVIVGVLILTLLSRHTHNHSTALFFVLAAGFIHAAYFGLRCERLTYPINFTRPLFSDVYKFSVLCFITVITNTVISISTELYNSKRRAIFIAVCVCYDHCVLAFLIGIQKTLTFCKYNSYFLFGTASESKNFNSALVVFCGNFNGEKMWKCSEYVLVYLPLTVLYLKSLSKKLPESTAGKYCALCQYNTTFCKCMAGYCLVVVWFVRPVFQIANVYHGLVTEDIIPNTAMMTLYICMLCTYIRDWITYGKMNPACVQMDSHTIDV